jgi:hypothetical protein
MAGRFEGLSDLEWQLFVDIFPQSRYNAAGACRMRPVARS